MPRKKVVYGEIDESLIFILRPRMEQLVDTHNAVQTANTWAELLELLPKEERERLQIQMEEADPQIKGTDEFRPEMAWGYQDGDWPGWPAREMLDWVPVSVEKLGSVSSEYPAGSILRFAVSDEASIVAAFEHEGFSVERNDKAVAVASGWV